MVHHRPPDRARDDGIALVRRGCVIASSPSPRLVEESPWTRKARRAGGGGAKLMIRRPCRRTEQGEQREHRAEQNASSSGANQRFILGTSPAITSRLTPPPHTQKERKETLRRHLAWRGLWKVAVFFRYGQRPPEFLIMQVLLLQPLRFASGAACSPFTPFLGGAFNRAGTRSLYALNCLSHGLGLD